ncbi:class I SAM-dependent methyltransferase [Kribbella ginsengisoli]|uniref:Class I SAM-dependent methyltransferase n=1 Tax=Kribbella ginsengisoli TaxID=363865 RepID=A0ABP6Y5E6_9ACTN
MADFLTTTRTSYDALAAEHAGLVQSSFDDLPLDRSLFATFAELVRPTGRPVADVGCGPGRVTVLLAELGLDAFGIDLSPGMLALARQSYPELRFEEGSMLALDVPDGSLGGVLAYYSVIHVPWEQRAAVFAEFYRVLAPGGVLMLAFQVGEDQVRRTEYGGTALELDVYRQRPDEVAGLLRDGGFELWMTAVRGRAEWEKVDQGYLIVRKPATTTGVRSG